jgi:hypothetical protein
LLASDQWSPATGKGFPARTGFDCQTASSLNAFVTAEHAQLLSRYSAVEAIGDRAAGRNAAASCKSLTVWFAMRRDDVDVD